MDEEPDGAQFLNSESNSSASSQSLLSRHLFSVQNQVRALQGEVAGLRGSSDFQSDRLDNFEHIAKSLDQSVRNLSNSVRQLERNQALNSAGLQAQAVALARVARRLSTLERSQS